MAELTSVRACIGCGDDDAPHLGETVTTPVADGVVRDERVHRCTPCQQVHRAAKVGAVR